MNKTDLINAVAAATGAKKVDIESIVKASFDAISDELSKSGNITLIGFGTFSVIERKARTGKNPQTGAPLEIAAKKVAKFKPGKALSDKVNPAPVAPPPPVVVETKAKKAKKK